MDRALAFIHAHYAEPLRVSSLADVAGVSESSFYRLFKRYTGRSVVEYLNEYRISRACVQLSRTDLPIYQIADDLGISIKTVEAHRANIMEKLNVNTVADLLRLALSRNS